MSSAAIPLPKPAGARPPFGPPPVTTFDSRPDDSGDPIGRRLTDSVNEVLRACKDADVDSVPMLQRLIDQRRKAVKRELDTLRMFDQATLPPLLANFYSVEFLAGDMQSGELDAERLYVRLLGDLDGAEARLAALVRERNG